MTKKSAAAQVFLLVTIDAPMATSTGAVSDGQVAMQPFTNAAELKHAAVGASIVYLTPGLEGDLPAIATAFAMQATGGKVNFLKWDRIHKNYFLYPANLPQLFEEN